MRTHGASSPAGSAKHARGRDGNETFALGNSSSVRHHQPFVKEKCPCVFNPSQTSQQVSLPGQALEVSLSFHTSGSVWLCVKTWLHTQAGSERGNKLLLGQLESLGVGMNNRSSHSMEAGRRVRKALLKWLLSPSAHTAALNTPLPAHLCSMELLTLSR